MPLACSGSCCRSTDLQDTYKANVWTHTKEVAAALVQYHRGMHMPLLDALAVGMAWLAHAAFSEHFACLARADAQGEAWPAHWLAQRACTCQSTTTNDLTWLLRCKARAAAFKAQLRPARVLLAIQIANVAACKGGGLQSVTPAKVAAEEDFLRIVHTPLINAILVKAHAIGEFLPINGDVSRGIFVLLGRAGERAQEIKNLHACRHGVRSQFALAMAAGRHRCVRGACASIQPVNT